ncbi:hypothetical protein COO60DRAFT_459994 [Scenedesmus sp. NREL 46B-D3]|nr:hypothetical protein COO60DRAFT_459994 [Scenedesmus sp. NREL 46B-D3]
MFWFCSWLIGGVAEPTAHAGCRRCAAPEQYRFGCHSSQLGVPFAGSCIWIAGPCWQARIESCCAAASDDGLIWTRRTCSDVVQLAWQICPICAAWLPEPGHCSFACLIGWRHVAPN